MHEGTTCLPSARPARGAQDHRLFLVYLSAFLGLGVLRILWALGGLSLVDSLPAPPITTTYCIDEKFKYLAEQDLAEIDLLAVGSSVTWRNLDLTPFVARGLAEHPMNAAPCYLHMDQIAFLTAFLLDHQRAVETVVSVVAPRDFADCSAADRAFFSPGKAAPYLFEGASPLLIYLTNFRPLAFFRDALQVAERRSDPGVLGPLVMGPYGAGPIEGTAGWSPPPVVDPGCFDALAAFEAMLAERGVRLVLASFPPSPAWRAAHDPQGDVMAHFEARLRAALRSDASLFVPSAVLAQDESLYFDAVHFQWRGAQRFSAELAARLAPALATSGDVKP